MERLAHPFFMMALILYYVPKCFKMKKSIYVKMHIVAGSISIAAILYGFINKIGTDDFLKYLGFAIIMLAIGISGYLIKKNYNLNRRIHIGATISFFLYLAGIIIF